MRKKVVTGICISYLESNTKILYNIEKSEQFAGFSVYTNNEATRQIQI